MDFDDVGGNLMQGRKKIDTAVPALLIVLLFRILKNFGLQLRYQSIKDKFRILAFLFRIIKVKPGFISPSPVFKSTHCKSEAT